MLGDQRALGIDGLVNARDLGGLRRRFGGSTPSDVFFRAENVDMITERGWCRVFELGIRTIVDLRRPDERDRDTRARPDWITTVAVDLDGVENAEFWADYWDNGLVGTALYYLPHMRAMPERAVNALSTLVRAPQGGVLFHCAAGRDRTGMVALLLLTALGTDEEEIVADYVESVRLGEARAANENGTNTEPTSEAICQRHGTTTEGAFRAAVHGLELTHVLDAGGMTEHDRGALFTWRGNVT